MMLSQWRYLAAIASHAFLSFIANRETIHETLDHHYCLVACIIALPTWCRARQRWPRHKVSPATRISASPSSATCVRGRRRSFEPARRHQRRSQPVVRRSRRRLQEWQLALRDAVFQNRFDLFNEFRAPFIFVPGDNEWTDCHRANNGGYDPLERLERLWTMFANR